MVIEVTTLPFDGARYVCGWEGCMEDATKAVDWDTYLERDELRLRAVCDGHLEELQK